MWWRHADQCPLGSVTRASQRLVWRGDDACDRDVTTASGQQRGVTLLSEIEWPTPPRRSLLPQEVPHKTPHMATDVIAPQITNEDLAQEVANIQRTLDETREQQALLAQALLNAIRGRWDAAQNGPQSVEAILVALNPGLQGKVEAVPFVPGR